MISLKDLVCGTPKTPLRCCIDILLVKALRKYCNPNKATNYKILDLGCGAGNYVGFLLSLGIVGWYIGIDINAYPQWPLWLGRSHSGKLQINFRQEDGVKLLHSNETFDFILCIQVLEHVENVKTFIKVIDKVLKPGGIALITFPTPLSIPLYGSRHAKRWLFVTDLNNLIKGTSLRIKEAISIGGIVVFALQLLLWRVFQLPTDTGRRLTSLFRRHLIYKVSRHLLCPLIINSSISCNQKPPLNYVVIIEREGNNNIKDVQ